MVLQSFNVYNSTREFYGIFKTACTYLDVWGIFKLIVCSWACERWRDKLNTIFCVVGCSFLYERGRYSFYIQLCVDGTGCSSTVVSSININTPPRATQIMDFFFWASNGWIWFRRILNCILINIIWISCI